MGEFDISEILEKVEELPTLSNVTNQVIRLTSDPKTTVSDLADTITQDQVTTAKVLKMANSAFYGYARKIFNIKEAIMVLGFNTVRNLVMAASIHNIMNRELYGYSLEKGELWRHSMTTALLARSLANKIDQSISDRAFIAGLVHDIGKVVLDNFMQDLFSKVIEKVKTENVPFMVAEKDVLGIDHASLGAKVSVKWNFPEELTETIALHHSPGDAKINPRLVSLIHIADAVSLSLGAGLGGDGLLYPVDGSAIEQLNLNGILLEETISEIAENIQDNETMVLE